VSWCPCRSPEVNRERRSPGGRASLLLLVQGIGADGGGLGCANATYRRTRSRGLSSGCRAIGLFSYPVVFDLPQQCVNARTRLDERLRPCRWITRKTPRRRIGRLRCAGMNFHTPTSPLRVSVDGSQTAKSPRQRTRAVRLRLLQPFRLSSSRSRRTGCSDSTNMGCR
jgi:hypothetical protein